MKTEYIIAGLVALYLLKKRRPAQNYALDTGAAQDFERPTWGANWISNQWSMINQGTAASTGQIKAGGYL